MMTCSDVKFLQKKSTPVNYRELPICSAHYIHSFILHSCMHSFRTNHKADTFVIVVFYKDRKCKPLIQWQQIFKDHIGWKQLFYLFFQGYRLPRMRLLTLKFNLISLVINEIEIKYLNQCTWSTLDFHVCWSLMGGVGSTRNKQQD